MKPTYLLTLLAIATAPFVNSPSLHATEMDSRIETSAKNSYVFKTYIKDDSVKTESNNGMVTLTGTVEEAYYKSLIQDTVEGLPGVKTVDNQLTVKSESPIEPSDGWLSLKVKTLLAFHRHVSGSKTEVSAENGTVILRGEASSLAQKELTAEYAKDVEGVKAVKNEMTIRNSPPISGETLSEKIDDASITAQIKASLLVHRSTSAIMTKIKTTDGVVTVRGVAKNPAEKSLVTKLVSDIYGVMRVINKMTIKGAPASNS